MKFLNLLAVLSILFTGTCVFAEGYCPSMQEFQNKNNYYQTKALSMIQNPNSVSADQAMQLSNEQLKYYDSILPGCLAYFKSTQAPDCSKLTVLLTGYNIMDKDKQINYRSQVLGLKSQLSNTCPVQVKSLDYFIK